MEYGVDVASNDRLIMTQHIYYRSTRISHTKVAGNIIQKATSFKFNRRFHNTFSLSSY